jgi:hypothetical protein
MMAHMLIPKSAHAFLALPYSLLYINIQLIGLVSLPVPPQLCVHAGGRVLVLLPCFPFSCQVIVLLHITGCNLQHAVNLQHPGRCGAMLATVGDARTRNLP